MSNTLQLGAGKWATGTDTVLAFNDENNNFKPLPFDFSRASSATVVNQSGLIETVGSGTPRIDFLGNTKGALLLEPQRTNLYTYSNDVSFWTKSNVVATSNYAISPEGIQNAFRAVFSSSTGFLYINALGTIGVDNTLSIWAKSNNGSSNKFRFFGNGSTIISNDYIATEEWQRFEFTYSCTSVTSGLTGASDSATNDILFYGFQHEVGSYATSYIPTSGQSGGVTRVADACNNENLNVDYSGDYTLYLEHETLSITEYNQFQFRQETSISYIFRVGNSINVGSGLYSATNTIGFNKFALSVGSDGSYSFYKNGSLLSSGSGLNANLETLKGDAAGMSIKDIKLYNTRLSNAELASLTTI